MQKSPFSSRAYLVIDREGSLKPPEHPDNLTIEQLNNSASISIDQIRELTRWAYLKPFSKKQKTAFILQAQKMTLEAQNALLKLLEEPPKMTVIILAVDDEKNLLPTVVSRCLLIGKWELRSGKLDTEMGILDTLINEVKNHISKNQDVTHQHLTSHFPHLTSIPQAFQFAEELSKKDRDEIIEILNAWTRSLRQTLLQNPNATTLDQLKKIKYTQKVLRANVNKRLALENLFLSLK